MTGIELLINGTSLFAIAFILIYIISGLNEKINFYKNSKYNLLSALLFGVGACICIYVGNEYLSIHYLDSKLIFVVVSTVLNEKIGGVVTSAIIIVFGVFIFGYFSYLSIIAIAIAVIIGAIFSKQFKKTRNKKFIKSFFLLTITSIAAYIIMISVVDRNHMEFTQMKANYFIAIGITLLFAYFIFISIINRMEKTENSNTCSMIAMALNDGIWHYNFETKEMYLSDRLCEIYGYSKLDKEYLIKNHEHLMHPEDLLLLNKEIGKMLSGEQKEFSIEVRILHRRKGFVWVLVKCVIRKDFNNKVVRLVGSYKEINTKKSQEKQLKRLARYDVLTGLPNRSNFFYRLSQSIAENDSGAVIYIDVDNFKNVNDNLGHSYGDALLMEIAERLSVYENEKSFISRLGGDEFIIVLKDEQSREKIKRYSKNLLRIFREPFNLSDTEFTMTVSIGIAFYPEQGMHAESVLMNADTAMYRAKQNGKNCYEIFDESMNKENLEKLTLENSLRKAIKEKGFTLYYQPQFSAVDKKLIGFEALIRWFDEEKGMIPTMEFILLAEQTGLIVDIGKWVMEEACLFSTDINSSTNKDIIVSINVSSLQLKENDFENSVCEIVKRTAADPSKISIEITETALMESFDENCSKIEKLRNMGFRISLDDFGTGYSSLNYLRKIPATEIKIDKSFIDDVCKDKKQKMLTKAIIDISHDLELKVIAEGVETEGQLEVLKELNCDYIQGYLLGRPNCKEENISILKRQA